MSAKRAALTAERLRSLFCHDKASGVFTRRVRRGNKRAGSIAGYANPSMGGRVVINIDGRLYYAAHLAWLYVKGEWPPDGYEIDHKDGDPTNDAWDNLRLATPSQNKCNNPKRSHNTVGFKGVTRMRDKFQARLNVDGVHYHLGTFDTAKEASRAYMRAAMKHHGAFARWSS